MKQLKQNLVRSHRIGKYVVAYTEEIAPCNEDRRDAVTDILVDLRHYCDTHGLSLGDLDRTAHQHYLAELAGE